MDLYGDKLEQLLSMLVMFVPVQDNEEDVAGFWNQVVFSITDIFSLYRTVLLRNPETIPVVAGPPGSMQQLQLRTRRLQYSIAAFLLRALRAVQVLFEMHAVRISGARRALRTCLRIEAVKLVLRLWLRSRTPFSFYVDEEALQDAQGAESNNQAVDPLASAEQFVGRRSGKTLRPLSIQADGGHAQLDGLVADAAVAVPRIMVAETLFHSRPLVHLLSMMRYGQTSWTAWLTALILDWLSIAFMGHGTSQRTGTRAAVLELAELRRRRNLLWWALARSPLYDMTLRRPCEVLERVIRRIPLLNMFNLMELVLALQKFYFSTSGT